MTAVHDEGLDAELARIQADADARMTEIRGRARAEPDLGKTVDQLRDDAERAESEDFTAFWESRRRTGKTLHNVLGFDVVLPAELPLRFEIEARRLSNDRSAAAVSHLFGLLFGAETYSRLYEAGLTPSQFMVLLMWGVANANGQDMTLAQAEVAAEDAKAKAAAGKVVVPSGSGGTSSGSGPSSRPTSRGSTRSGKKRSRR